MQEQTSDVLYQLEQTKCSVPPVSLIGIKCRQCEKKLVKTAVIRRMFAILTHFWCLHRRSEPNL